MPRESFFAGGGAWRSSVAFAGEVTGQVVALIVMDSRDLRDRATSICATISGARVRGTRWSERFYDSNCDEAER